MDKESYFQSLKEKGAFPEGFRFSSVPIEFFPIEKKSAAPYQMNLSLVLMDHPTDAFAALFTRNQFPGAPVLIGREMLKGRSAQGLVVNNRISNVQAADGVRSALAVTHAVEREAHIGADSLFPVSTGIIGWQLPQTEMIQAAPLLVQNLTKGNAADLAQAIMTTDRYPKMASARVGMGRIVAVAKGAGMVEPNLATMLCFVLTDLKVPRRQLQAMLKKSVDVSFNTISVDSDQSTSDSVIAFSSGVFDAPPQEDFQAALNSVLQSLAQEVVRNGEGTAHVMQVTVNGFANDGIAAQAAKAVINSPLVKTAIYGNDPNVGRFIASLGDFCGNSGIALNPEWVTVKMGGELIYDQGAFVLDEAKEERLFRYLKQAQLSSPSPGYPEHHQVVAVEVSLKGRGHAVVYGSDLSYEYIKENAEYRS